MISSTSAQTLRKVGRITITAATSGSISGLTGDKKYIVIGQFKNVGAGGADIKIYLNNDTTAAHYDTRYLLANVGSANVTTDRLDDCDICQTNGGFCTYIEYKVLIEQNGYAIYTCDSVAQTALTTYSVDRFAGCKTDATMTEITKITISCANNLTGYADVYVLD